MTMQVIEWNAAQLQDFVWRGLGARKHIVGRDGINRATELCVSRWPVSHDTETLPTADDPVFVELAKGVTADMKSYDGKDKRYGFIWTLVLSAVISQLVRLLVDWWIKRRENRIAMNCMKIYETTKGYQCAATSGFIPN